MKIVLIDNYDSFTYNLYHYISQLKCKVEVYRNDKIDAKTILRKNLKKLLYHLDLVIQVNQVTV